MWPLRQLAKFADNKVEHLSKLCASVRFLRATRRSGRGSVAAGGGQFRVLSLKNSEVESLGKGFRAARRDPETNLVGRCTLRERGFTHELTE